MKKLLRHILILPLALVIFIFIFPIGLMMLGLEYLFKNYEESDNFMLFIEDLLDATDNYACGYNHEE